MKSIWNWGSTGFAFAALAVLAPCLHAAESPTTAPTTAVAWQAKVSPDAREVIDQMDRAYSQLKTLQLAGTFASEIDAGGQVQKQAHQFTAAFSAPNRFRHAMTDDVLCGSTGSKVFCYLKDKNVFTSADAPKDRVAMSDMPRPVPQLLQRQNPSLMLALSRSAATEMTEGVTVISKLPDSTLSGSACSMLLLSLPDQTSMTFAIDQQSHLVRQVRTDIKPLLLAQGVPDVRAGMLTLDYTTITADGAMQDEQFAWKAPDGTRDLSHEEMGDADQASALEGKPVPAFKLAALDGGQVSEADIKGSVTVLDFWATWCGPCKVSLPHLSETYEKYRPAGVKVYAVNSQEEKADVQKFVDATKLAVPVLLDGEGKATEAFLAQAIPETVVIGKNGIVKKVLVGFTPETVPAIKKAIESALAE